MATNPSTLAENVGRITAPDANYTYGSAKDDSTGSAGDGTPIKKALMNDSYGFFQAALVAAGIVPSGNADTVLQSQILQALQGVVGSFSDKSQWPTVANGADVAHDIVFSAGKITDSNGKIPIVSGGLTKQIDAAWAAGTDMGGLFSGTVAADTTYHLFFIVKDSDGTVDAGFDTDSAAANIPAGYTAYRRIASLYTDASSNWVQFYQQGDYFGLKVAVSDLTITDTQDTARLVGLSVPSGLSNLVAHTDWTMFADAGTQSFANTLVTSVLQDDTAVVNGNLNFLADGSDGYAGKSLRIPVTSTPQFRYRSKTTGVTVAGTERTEGWADDRTE